MKRRGAQGLSAPDRFTAAANEEFTTPDDGLDRDGLDRLEYSGSGWDPYEVWRTRVKSSSRAKGERERDPLR
jgi:hypothetical protein